MSEADKLKNKQTRMTATIDQRVATVLDLLNLASDPVEVSKRIHDMRDRMASSDDLVECVIGYLIDIGYQTALKAVDVDSYFEKGIEP